MLLVVAVAVAVEVVLMLLARAGAVAGPGLVLALPAALLAVVLATGAGAGAAAAVPVALKLPLLWVVRLALDFSSSQLSSSDVHTFSFWRRQFARGSACRFCLRSGAARARSSLRSGSVSLSDRVTRLLNCARICWQALAATVSVAPAHRRVP